MFTVNGIDVLMKRTVLVLKSRAVHSWLDPEFCLLSWLLIWSLCDLTQVITWTMDSYNSCSDSGWSLQLWLLCMKHSSCALYSTFLCGDHYCGMWSVVINNSDYDRTILCAINNDSWLDNFISHSNFQLWLAYYSAADLHLDLFWWKYERHGKVFQPPVR